MSRTAPLSQLIEPRVAECADCGSPQFMHRDLGCFKCDTEGCDHDGIDPRDVYLEHDERWTEVAGFLTVGTVTLCDICLNPVHEGDEPGTVGPDGFGTIVDVCSVRCTEIAFAEIED